MFLLLIFAIGLYLYQTGELQKIAGKFQPQMTPNVNEARRVIDLRYAAGQISTEEYTKLKNLI